MQTLRFALAAFAALIFTSASAKAAELIYFGSEACSVCETWDMEVGKIYPKTEESEVLPLRYQSVHDEKPEDIAFIKRVVYTPTFVAVEDGREIGRIVGYMGDFFFWEQVGGLVQKLKPVETALGPETCVSDGTAAASSSC